MDYSGFQSVLTRSKRKIAIVGVILALCGAPFIIAVIVSESRAMYWGFGLFFVLLGVLITIISVRDLSKMKSGKLPLLNAMNGNERDYLVWIYLKQINSKVEGVKVGTAHNVVLYTKHNKMQELVLGKKTSPEEVINFLHSQFPEAYVGYTDENRAAVSKILNKKV